MKTKEAGISIFISMGTSLLVLSLAFATLTSIARSIDQASNIQRSTQLFFASESGAEAAFFHHNSRGPGTNFTGANTTQIIAHPSVNANTNWTIQGRTSQVDNAINNDATIVDILKEGQTYKIPFQWDPATNPGELPPVNLADYGEPNRINDLLEIRFFQTPADIPSSAAKDDFEARYGFQADAFDPLQGSFDFGDSVDEDILIDWSITRKNSVQGVQTFIPVNNQDCSGYISGAGAGYICEDDIEVIATGDLRVTTSDPLPGKVLPGSKDTSLDYFWDCLAGADETVRLGETCSDYQLTIRPLLKFNDTVSGAKVPGIPFQLKLQVPGGIPTHFPLNTYTVVSDVALEDFSQRIEIEIPERTSIGAFDYVIFD